MSNKIPGCICWENTIDLLCPVHAEIVADMRKPSQLDLIMAEIQQRRELLRKLFRDGAE